MYSLVESTYRLGGYVALEKLKHNIMRESEDFEDLADAVEKLSVEERRTVLNLFSVASVPNAVMDHKVKYIVMSDLDNTAFENAAVAKSVYGEGLIPGFAPLVYGLTHGGTTTAIFLSARPKAIERSSIVSIKKHLDARQIPYAFEGGNLSGPALCAIATGGFALSSKIGRRLMSKAAVECAKAKFKSYKRMSRFFPTATFVFFGDDTQGDSLFAEMLVNDRFQNRAYIRAAANDGEAMEPTPDARICYHSSYYGVILDDQWLAMEAPTAKAIALKCAVDELSRIRGITNFDKFAVRESRHVARLLSLE